MDARMVGYRALEGVSVLYTVRKSYTGDVYPDTPDEPCPAPLVARYSDTPGYTGMYRYSYTANTRYIPIQHPSGVNVTVDTTVKCCGGVWRLNARMGTLS